MTQKILKNGNSLAVTIPAKFAKILGLQPGSVVKTQVDMATGQVTYSFLSASQMSLLNK